MFFLKKGFGFAMLFVGVWFFYDKLYIIESLREHKIGVDISKLFFPIALIGVGIYLLFSKKIGKNSKNNQ